jgi:asparagine synthase (glutamine-hydrolysing)
MEPAHSLQENLLRQLYMEPLPALLRYEDHNSMAWSVESRTPFMDYRLIEFTLGLPERFVYRNGIRKRILRDAMHNILPSAIEKRTDKMGFVTPEELWLKNEGKSWFISEIDIACKEFDGIILNGKATRQYLDEMQTGSRKFDFVPWRILCFNKWFNL